MNQKNSFAERPAERPGVKLCEQRFSGRQQTGINPAFFAAKPNALGVAQQVQKSHQDGILNLSNRELESIPSEIFDPKLQQSTAFWDFVPTTKLDLSFNRLRRICNEVGMLNDLLSLKVRKNSLEELPPSLFTGCLLLKHLDVAQNLLCNLDSQIELLIELRELLLFENELTSLPNISRLSQLQVLDISNNRIETFPSASLPYIVILNCSKNRLSLLPPHLSSSVALEVLECSCNRITALPSLSVLSRLKRVDASDNIITEIPELPRSKALTFLNFANNRLRSTLSFELLDGISSLSELHLSGNGIVGIDDQIYKFSTLKVLDISNNGLTHLPHTLGYMSNLHRLSAVGNRIHSVRQNLLSNQSANSTEQLKQFLRTRGPNPEHEFDTDEMPRTDGIRMQSKVRSGCNGIDFRIREVTQMSLDLSNLEISSLQDCCLIDRLIASPHVLDPTQTWIGLLELDLSGNQLNDIPPELNELPVLRRLSLSSNKLGSALASLALPPTLVDLDVSKNALDSFKLGQILAGVPRLANLKASNNFLDQLPTTLSNLSELRELLLSFNKICSLATIDFSRLIMLESVDLSHNRIEDISPLANVSSRLKTLMLDNNSISNIPVFLGSARFNFLTLSFNGNPQKGIRAAVLQKGTSAIVELLRMRDTC